MTLSLHRTTLERSAIFAVLCAAGLAQGATPIEGLISRLEGGGFRQAMDELAATGSAAVPALIRYLNARRVSDVHRIRAVRVLGRIGKDATEAIPALIEMLPDRTLRTPAVVALGRIGPYAPERGPDIRSALVERMLAERAGVPGAVVSTSGHPVIAETYSRTLLDPGDSLARISAALRHDNPFVRAFAAEILFARGEVDETGIAALQEAVTRPHPKQLLIGQSEGIELRQDVDLDRQIHRLAARTLVRIAPGDPRSLEAHLTMLEAVGPEARLEAVMALGRLGSAAAPAVPRLLRLLEQDLPAIRREAVTALGMIGPGAASATGVLEQLAAGRDPQLAERARSALRQIRRREEVPRLPGRS